MKKFLLFAFSLLTVFTLWADDRTEQEMQQIALSKLSGAQVKGLFPTQFHVDRLKSFDEMNVYGNDDGFVFVSRDSRFTPVLGYSEGHFDPNNMPEGLQWWIEAMNASLQARRANGVDEEARHLRQARLISGYSPVSNFVSARWGQSDPFNSYCPDISGSKPPCGCVATAMGQILKYYEYPAQGKGDGGYTKGSGSEVRTKVNGVYNWSAMKNYYVSVKQADRDAVGPLLRDCGYAARMSYEKGGSGAFSNNAASAFVYNFSYDSLAIRYYSRDFFAEQDWLTLIYDELTAKRPILYGGIDPTYGGHAFVFSGFDADGLIYVNWGWNGDANGHYSISDLAPTGILGSSATDHFNSDQDMIFGFRPTEESAPGEVYESMWGSDSWKLTVNGSSTLRFTTENFYNFHFQTFYGSVGIYLENVDNGRSFFIDIAKGPVQPMYGVSGTTKNYNSTNLKDVPAGTYYVTFVSIHVKDAKPSIVRQKDKGAIYYELVKKADNSLTISAAKEQYLSPTYKLIYMVDGEVYKTYQMADGAAITPEPDPVKPGYTFSGWSEIPEVMPKKDVTVTGSFIMNPTHTLTFMLNGVNYETLVLPEGIKIEAPEVEKREGYKFGGWKNLPEYMPNHDLTIYGAYRACQQVQLSAAGYATFYDADFSFNLPDGVIAYVVDDVKDGKLHYKECMLHVAPFNTAVVLKGDANKEVELLEYDGTYGEVYPYDGVNYLYGSNHAATTTADVASYFYKLAYGHSDTYQSNVFGWFWGAADGEAFSIEAHRAWLAVPKTVSAVKPRLYLIDGTAESVLATDVDTPAAEPLYDLQGRRVLAPVRGGVYIKNGTKVVLK